MGKGTAAFVAAEQSAWGDVHAISGWVIFIVAVCMGNWMALSLVSLPSFPREGFCTAIMGGLAIIGFLLHGLLLLLHILKEIAGGSYSIACCMTTGFASGTLSMKRAPIFLIYPFLCVVMHAAVDVAAAVLSGFLIEKLAIIGSLAGAICGMAALHSSTQTLAYRNNHLEPAKGDRASSLGGGGYPGILKARRGPCRGPYD